MEEPKLRYSESELKEFESILLEKIGQARIEFEHLASSITKKEGGGDNSGMNSLDDGAEALEKEHLNQLAVRTQKFIGQLDKALVRIKNGTYGICVDTGNLIPKERLRVVPHTQHTIEAKNSKR